MTRSASCSASGPLKGLRIVEFEAIGPVPFAGMLLSDMGADIIRVDRPGTAVGEMDFLNRGRHRVEADLKDPASVSEVVRLCELADVVIEGFRPGVMERLGFGPDILCARNPKLVYGRMTGWGQHGPLATAAGHDINYIALSGALAAIGGSNGRPVAPLNLVGDYGGGAMYLVMGVLAALLEVHSSGKGQVVDAAMCDGSTSLMSLFYSLLAQGKWTAEREVNIIDGAAPFYGSYECADGKYVAVGALESKFYAVLLKGLQLDGIDVDSQNDQSKWPALKITFAKTFKTKSQGEWIKVFEGLDACFAPILNMQDAPFHPHFSARETFVSVEGVVQPGPAPRFSRTVSQVQFNASALNNKLCDLTERWSR
ncbi:CaiB/BaiF CoA transferase family protein [Bradyrhizobium sp. SYSU BS000235]|uniref:CaiB/BaiF CoA transferase family protein n=1 Tax=Bradyrhizobium sp. SYSU BS000235 TaxID=3411332 RepID=UPI003C707647